MAMKLLLLVLPLVTAQNCAPWCSEYLCPISTFDSSCGECDACESFDAGTICSWWCNSYTCGLPFCAGCSVCPELEAGEFCAPWCNVFTCELQHCEGCSECPTQASGGYCASWCNEFTKGISYCDGCEHGPALPEVSASCLSECPASPEAVNNVLNAIRPVSRFLYNVERDPTEDIDLLTSANNATYQALADDMTRCIACYLADAAEPDWPDYLKNSLKADIFTSWGVGGPPVPYDSALLAELDPLDSGPSVFTQARTGGMVPYDGQLEPQPPLPTVERTMVSPKPPNIAFLLVDDWGFNDVSFRSSSMPKATPNTDQCKETGINLERYYVHTTCGPSRAQLLTGRYPTRNGFQSNPPPAQDMPLSETLLPEELQRAGYRTYMAGKWHLGFESYAHTPRYRGFDRFYGYFSGITGFYDKCGANGPIAQFPFFNPCLIDLHDNETTVTDPVELTQNVQYVMNDKVVGMIADHKRGYGDSPFFLYNALAAVHDDAQYGVTGAARWPVPPEFLSRCSEMTVMGEDTAGDGFFDEIHYCAMNLLADYSIGVTLQAIRDIGEMDNTLVILSTDNGGTSSIRGVNYPLRGGKNNMAEGGIHGTGIVCGGALPASARGTDWGGLFQLTDWMPTIMHVATHGAWTGSQLALDGYNLYDEIVSNAPSPRTQIFHGFADSLINCASFAGSCNAEEQVNLGNYLQILGSIRGRPTSLQIRASLIGTSGGMRVGDYKMLTGAPAGDSPATAPPLIFPTATPPEVPVQIEL